MAKLSITERIAQLEARKQALKARLNKHERAVDTRRKVLLGAMVLDAIERSGSDKGSAVDRAFGATLADWVRRELPGFLTRPVDRTLFPEFLDQTAAAIGGIQIVPGSPTNDPEPDPFVSTNAGSHDGVSARANAG